MSEKHTRQLLEILFFIAIIITCIASVCVGIYFSADTTSLHENTIRKLSSGWQYQTDTGRHEIPALPTTIKPNSADGSTLESLTLYYQLPENLPPNPCLEFISHQTSVEVFVDNRLIFTYGVNNNAPADKLLGNARNMITLPSDSGGKEVSVRLISPYSSGFYRLSTITLGSRAELLYRFAYSNIGMMVFCLISLFFCMIVLFVAIYLKIKKIEINGISLVLFALFVFLSAIWVITDSDILQLLTSNFSLIYFISHMTFMLFPVPLFLFLRYNVLYGKHWYSTLGILYLLVFFLRVGLFFSGVADLEITLFITHAMMAVSTVTGCILLLKEWRLYHNRTTLLFLVGFIILGFCLLVSLLIFFLAHEVKYSLYFVAVMMVLMIAMLYRIMFHLQSIAKEGIKAQVYREMAYIDILTNLSNRLAFEEDMHAIQEKPECYTLTFVMLDINRLKHVNDTYGHGAGDSLIQCAADCIRDKFAPVGKCYRIGGDEFVVVLKDFSEQSLDKILKEFQGSVAEANAGNPEGLSISSGYATGLAEGENFAYHLLDKADQCMYAQKKQMHQDSNGFSKSY